MKAFTLITLFGLKERRVRGKRKRERINQGQCNYFWFIIKSMSGESWMCVRVMEEQMDKISEIYVHVQSFSFAIFVSTPMPHMIYSYTRVYECTLIHRHGEKLIVILIPFNHIDIIITFICLHCTVNIYSWTCFRKRFFRLVLSKWQHFESHFESHFTKTTNVTMQSIDRGKINSSTSEAL